jgi:hypothetical protein
MLGVVDMREALASACPGLDGFMGTVMRDDLVQLLHRTLLAESTSGEDWNGAPIVSFGKQFSSFIQNGTYRIYLARLF